MADSLIKVLRFVVDRFMQKPGALERLQHWQSGSEGGEEAALHGEGQVALGCSRHVCELEAEMFRLLAGGSAEAPLPAYNDQYRRLHTNLRLNEYMAMDIYLGHVAPGEVAVMRGDDMLTGEARKQSELTKLKAHEAKQLDWAQKMRPHILESIGLETGQGAACKKCRGKNTNYMQKQTRSADEPMTA